MAEAAEAAAPAPKERDTLPDFLKGLLYPAALGSLRDAMPAGHVRVQLHKARGQAPQEITLINMFPFMTLQDVKLALYNELKRDVAAIPEFVYLATNTNEAGRAFIGGRNAPLDFSWNIPGLSPNSPFLNTAPFEIVTGKQPLDARFLDAAGERRIIAPLPKERITLEDAFFKRGYKELPVIQAYLYSDLLAAMPDPKPPSAKDWNGRLGPYFPYLTQETAEGGAEFKKRADRLATIFTRRQQFLTLLESLLDKGAPLLPLAMAGIRFLRLTWPKKAEMAGIEAQFYEAAVSERRPFMRLIPTEGSGISKVFLRDGKTPDIYDPQLLVNWSQEVSPTPEQDYAFAKVLVRRGLTNIPPIYATMRLFNDGTADAIVEPPKGMKKLDPRSDLNDYGEVLLEGLADLPYLSSLPDIGNAAVVLGVKMRRDAAQALTPRALRQRLPAFSAFFQEILPLPGERPLAMLRYKLVSNFATEDRIQTFITQVMNRKLVRGEAGVSDIVELVADEFQLDIAEARRRVADKLANQAQVALVAPETKDYMLTNNPGIDVAIFAQHPFYTFHLYRVDSMENLQRIVTALSLLISAEPEDLVVSAKAVKELATAEAAEAAAAAGEGRVEEEEEAPKGVGAVSRGNSASASPEGEAAGEGEGENGGFENVDEANVAAAAAAAGTAPPPAEGSAEDLGGADDLPDYLDDFAFGGDEEAPDELTLEEARAADEAARTAKTEGTPFPEPPLPGILAAPARGAAAAAMPPAQFREQIAAAVVPPKEELEGLAGGVKAVGGPPAAAAAAAAAAEPENEEEASAGPAAAAASGKSEKGLAQFFIRKLQEADMRLFRYDKTHPSLKRYVSSCQPTYGRQPAVLTEEQFQAVREEYEKDNIVFHVYPLEPGEPDKPKGVIERDYFTVLRYGSTPQNQNYYLCSRYFCTRDEMPILEKDLDSTKMRRPEGAAKKAGECPFCRGTVIRNQRAPGPNETILERATARLATSRHLYIRFLGKTPHPEGFYLPCCFIDEVPVRFKSAAFDKYREWGVPPKPGAAKTTGRAAAAAAEEDEGGDEDAGAAAAAGEGGPRTEAGLPLLSYDVTLANVAKKYILGAEKIPLEVGNVTTGNRGEPQIGLLPTVLDPYFDQDPTQIVRREAIAQRVKPDGNGFLRIGVENRVRYQNDSLLAALAPFYGKNTAQDMKDLLDEKIKEKVFLGLNYGNLALEFYNPSDTVLEEEETRNVPAETWKKREATVLREWASLKLQVDMSEENEAAIRRAYLSYRAFIVWLNSTEKKEFRHLALLLAQSGLMRKPPKPGITFIVLDITREGTLQVRCPPFGYNPDLMAKNDVGFLLHHWSGVWEPIFHVDNRDPEEREVLGISTLLFQQGSAAQWPPIVKQRLQEYISQCSSSARGAYTSQSKINPLAMIPASLAKRVMLKDPRVALGGLVRDSYNHLAALLYVDKTNPGAGFIPLPVADDGELMFNVPFMMDWDDPAFKRAPIDLVLQFYKSYVEDRFRLYPGFSPVRIVKSRRTDEVEAVQLRNGLYVPCGPPSSEEAAEALAGQPVVQVDEMEWVINHQIALEEHGDEVPGEKERMTMVEFQETFEHLRLTFSNWLATDPEGGALRKQLEDTIFSRRLPLFEKRKRLEILLAREVASWITTDFDPEEGEKDAAASLLRVDCTLRDQGSCDGKCAWKAGEEGAEGRCLLHVKPETELGESDTKVSAPRVLLLRLIEELLRYGERRRQLLEQDVGRIAAFEKPVDLPGTAKGSKQRIYPEKSAAWFELLRLDWAKRADEKPRYLEEMTRVPIEDGEEEAAEAAPALPAEDPSTALPPTVLTVVNGAGGPDPKTGTLRLLRGSLEAILTILGLVPAQLGVTEATAAFTPEMIRELVRMTGRVIVQIDVREDPPVIIAHKPFRALYPDIPCIVITAEGPAALVKDPRAPAFLKKEELPNGLADIVAKAKGVLGMKAAAAPAAKL